MKNKGPLYVACILLATVLMGAGISRFPIEYDRQTGISYVTNITFPGTVTGGAFVGDGSKITGITGMTGGSNWFSTLVVTGLSSLGETRGMLWDIDAFLPSNTVMSVTEGSTEGPNHSYSATFTPIFSNCLGAVAGPSTTLVNAVESNYGFSWDAVPGASAYFIEFNFYQVDPPVAETRYYLQPASDLTVESEDTPNYSGAAFPSLLSQTNEVTIAWTNGLQRALTSSGIVNFNVIPTTTNALPATNCQTVTIFNGTNFTLRVFQGTNYFSLGPGFGVGPLGGIGGNSSNISISAVGGSITGATWRFEQ
jgi:hypothetical protein